MGYNTQSRTYVGQTVSISRPLVKSQIEHDCNLHFSAGNMDLVVMKCNTYITSVQ